MSDHFTTLRRVDGDRVVASCPEHGPVGIIQPMIRTGFNAVITEATAHDDMVHGVRRSAKAYRQALADEAQEFRA